MMLIYPDDWMQSCCTIVEQMQNYSQNMKYSLKASYPESFIYYRPHNLSPDMKLGDLDALVQNCTHEESHDIS